MAELHKVLQPMRLKEQWEWILLHWCQCDTCSVGFNLKGCFIGRASEDNYNLSELLIQLRRGWSKLTNPTKPPNHNLIQPSASFSWGLHRARVSWMWYLEFQIQFLYIKKTISSYQEVIQKWLTEVLLSPAAQNPLQILPRYWCGHLIKYSVQAFNSCTYFNNTFLSRKFFNV